MIAAILVAAATALAQSDVVARVDGVAVTRAELARRMDAMSGPGGAAGAADRAIEQIVNDVLLAAEARRMGIAGTPEVKARVDADLRVAAGIALIEQVASSAQVSDEMLREMFHANSDLASFDALYFATRDDAAAALERIKKGSDFDRETPGAVVARVHPKPAEAPPSMRAELDSTLASALFAASPGQLVGPIQTRNGFAVARLHRKEVGTDEQFTARRAALEKHARKQLKAQARKHFGAQLRARSGVKLDEPFLRGLDGLQATPQQLDHVLATVGATPLRYRDVYPSIRALGGGHMAGPGVKVALAWQAIETRLIEQSAVERGLLASPTVVALRPELERTALAAAAAAKIEAGAAPPSDREIEAFYERNKEALGTSFKRALPAAAAGAAAEKRNAAVNRRLGELRAKSSIGIDRDATSQTVAGSAP